ncbi:Polyadenylate-binding protein-interacting protein 4 [Capsicum annuum]|nr:Polyadenylate-binding protein-interacting protein 4 [Capsicum annuum]
MGSPFTTFEGLPGKGVVSPWNEGFSFIFELSSENLGESKEKMQQPMQARPSANGYGCRKVDRETGTRLETKVQSGRTTSCQFTGIILKMAHLIKDSSEGMKNTSEAFSKPPSKTLIILGKEFVQVTAKGVPTTLDGFRTEVMLEQQQELLTDSCISQSRHIEVERQLERWVPDDDAPECPELDNVFDGHWNRGWDQFEANETLFGVKSTFDEDLYTTKLERGPQMSELEKEALRIAREIEGEDTRDFHLAEERGIQLHENLEVDDETRFSAVFREVDDSGYDDCEDILLDSRNDETFQGISNAMDKSSTYMSRRKQNDGAQVSSRSSAMDEVQSSQLSTSRDVYQTCYDDHAKESSVEVVPKDASILNRRLKALFSEHAGASCNKEDTRNQMVAEVAQISVFEGPLPRCPSGVSDPRCSQENPFSFIPICNLLQVWANYLDRNYLSSSIISSSCTSCHMENRLYFRVGAKSYDLTEINSTYGIWYEWVESARFSMRRMSLSRGALLWLCRRLKEASDIKGKSFKCWRCVDLSTYIYCSLKFNEYGRFISITAVNGDARSVIILPENTFNEAWEELTKKIENFINKPVKKQISITTDKDDYNRGNRGGRYKDAMPKNKWAALQHPIKTDSAAKEGSRGKDPLRRSLVGSFPGCSEIPTRNNVKTWAPKTLKDSKSSSRMKTETCDGGRSSSDISALHVLPADQDKITNASQEKLDRSVSSKIQGASQSASSRVRPSSSALSASDGTGAAATLADNGLSRTSSEFKLNPNAKSFVPSQSPLRPASPVSDNSFYYPVGVATVPNMHGMPLGVGPSFSAHQPVIFNPQATPVPQQFFHPNGPQYGQQMMIGHPRQVVYMPSYPSWLKLTVALLRHDRKCRSRDESTNQVADHIALWVELVDAV